MNIIALLGLALLILGICVWLGALHLAVGWVPLVIVGGCILAVVWYVGYGPHRRL